MSDDPHLQLKAAQREGWALFGPLEALTTIPAAELVKHARVHGQQAVLDVGCGTGVVAVTAARLGARVRGLDLSPVLVERAKVNAATAGVEVDFQAGDAEALPFADASFDVVLSQFGHMFAPRPQVAIAQMLRVLKPGGTIAFSTWPPEHFVGQMFALVSRHLPSPPGLPAEGEWGNPDVVRQRLGGAVTELFFDRAVLPFPALSPAHYRQGVEETLGPVVKLVASLRQQPEQLALFRAEFDALIARYLEGNHVRQQYLMTRATRR